MGSNGDESVSMDDKKRVLIFGAGGMLGHKLYQQFRDRYDTWATIRGQYARYGRFKLFDPERICGGVDAYDLDSVERTLKSVQPDVVINCIGIVKQLPAANDPIPSIELNALWPHRLAKLSREVGARMLHISTDCVFNGKQGNYSETDHSDAYDLYGRTKFLGEVSYPSTLTLRTSIIGREISSSNGLVEWFLTNRPNGTVRGFRNAIYTGFSTQAMTDIIGDVIDNHPTLSGMYQVASEPISKYELLLRLRDAYDTDIQIEPYDDVRIDRSLDSSRYREETGFTPPSWKGMIEQMAADPTPYDKWKENGS